MSHRIRPAPPVPSQILRLLPHDTLRLDAEPLLRLQSVEGAQAAHALVARAREELCLRLDRIAVQYGAGALTAIGAEARGIMAIAVSVGLSDLTRAASHVSNCAETDDSAALAATVARVLRLGERALALIGNLRAPAP